MTTSDQYRAELDALLKQNELLSNEVLVNRHEEVRTHLNEIQASISLLAQDCPDIVFLDRQGGGPPGTNYNDGGNDNDDDNDVMSGGKTVVDFECFKEKVAGLDALRSTQMAAYLERDSMDNFLRYVVKSNTGSLPVSSLEDPVFLELREKVHTLESRKIPEVEDEIGSIKLKSSGLSQEIFDMDCQTKEVCTEIAEELDSCFALLDELNELQAQVRRQGENSLKAELENAREAYNQLTRVQALERERSKLQQELDKHSRQEFNNNNNNNNGSGSGSDSNILGTSKSDTIQVDTLELLIKLLEKNLVPELDAVSDFHADSTKSTVTFKVRRTIPVEIRLDGTSNGNNSYPIVGITIGKSLEHAIVAKEVMQNFKGNSHVFAAIRSIVNKLS